MKATDTKIVKVQNKNNSERAMDWLRAANWLSTKTGKYQALKNRTVRWS